MHGALELHDEELQMGSEGWRIVEDATGRLNGMALQRKRTVAFMKRNDLMIVIMTTLAVGLKAGLMEALDNWCMAEAGRQQGPCGAAAESAVHTGANDRGHESVDEYS